MLTNEEILEEQTCTMCGTKFFGDGSMCSNECVETWVKENVNGPWNKTENDGETNKGG